MRKSPLFFTLRILLLYALAVAPWRVVAGSNVLILIADDLGVDSFPLTASAGASLPPMPNLTALKNSGVLFRNAYAHPTCSPTRAAILTGRHPFRTGIGAQLTTAASPQLQASEFTLPDAFAANPGLGYSLAMFGKWHLNSGAGTNDSPRTVGGWPHFEGTIIGALPDYSAWTKIVNGAATATTDYATSDTADDVISWIQSRPSGTPWLAWAAFNSPHSPLHFPPNDLHSYDAAAATDRNHYEAMCEALDTEIGRVLANVNLATTTVIFVGDNGTPQNVIQPPYSAAKSKGTLYAGGTRVPMIIAGAGVVSPNRESTAMVNAADIYATVLDLAGVNAAATQPAGNPVDSRSLLPILQNTADVSRTAFSETFGTELAASVSGRAVTGSSGYTLIQFKDGREELFATASDANQATNLLGSGISTAAAAAYAELKLALANYTAGGVPSSPNITSWFTRNSGRYARIFRTLADQAAQTSVTTWSRGAGVQASPTYADVNQVDFSTDWVYIHTTGLASHIMGPWYLNAAKTNLFPNYPANTGALYRIPRTPAIPATKVSTGLGAAGRMVNGVSMFDCRDAFSYSTANAADATPGGAFTGDGIWNRDAYHNESVTFDPAYAHQAGSNYHYHAHPIALRYQLGDHVDFNAATGVYAESTTVVSAHSPIVAWAADGLPVYGPYGYSEPMNTGSGLRRMTSGFVLRNGTNGTVNLAVTGRTTLPAWAARVQSRSAALAANQYGPAVGAAFALGHYIEDFEYLGDLGFTHGEHFDLNEQNARFCVTPDFPSGTWAYFTTMDANAVPVFPYTTGRQFFGTPTGGAVTEIVEPVATSFVGGPHKPDAAGGAQVNSANGNVTLTWSAIEGGTYRVEASDLASGWTTIVPAVTVAGGDAGSVVETGGAAGRDRRFYRTVRTGVSAYDSTGFPGTTGGSAGGGPNTVTPNSGARGTVVNVVIQLDPALTPNLPPANVAVFSVTVAGGGITVSGISRPSQTLVNATFTVDAGAAVGARNVSVRFGSATGVQRTIAGAFTVN
jgi:arylsulfatase A-like enzyme